MQYHRRLPRAAGLLCLTLCLIFGCQFNPPKARYLLDPVVLAEVVLDLPGEPSFRGSGVIIRHQGDYTYILTCKHLLSNPATKSVQVGTGKRGENWAVPQDTVFDRHDEQDAAILRTARLRLPQVRLGSGVPRLFAREYTTGWCPAIDEIMSFPGEVILNWPALIVSGQATAGCSGGAVFSQYDGVWVAVGLITALGHMSIGGNELRLNHITMALPIVALRPWIKEVLEDERQSEGAAGEPAGAEAGPHE